MRSRSAAVLGAVGISLVLAPGCGEPPVIQGEFDIDPPQVQMTDLAALAANTDHVEIRNEGEGVLEIQSIDLIDDGNGLFEVVVTDALPFTIEPGENFYFGVGFYGAPSGTYVGQAEVAYDLKPQHLGGGRPSGAADAGTGVQTYALALEALVGIADVDEDGDGFSEADGDCDDQDATSYPDAPELCDGLDNDCDGDVPADEVDLDEDGYAGCAGDCDDGNAAVHPDAEEICDGLDNDCDGVVGDEVDLDEDGYTPCTGDCDDQDATVYEGAVELCDGVDNDCDGVVPGDELDNDADGFIICEGDCDDSNPDTYPGAAELCDGLDNDCDGAVGDELDDDGDGFSPCQGDCDDGDPQVHPGAEETWIWTATDGPSVRATVMMRMPPCIPEPWNSATASTTTVTG